MLIWIIISTFLISLISFVGAITLFLKERFLNKILLLLVSLSAGALIGGAFLHLLPESISEVGVGSSLNLFLYFLFGFCLFFIFEQFLLWHHHHSIRHKSEKIRPVAYLILISDSIHNFIDGVMVAASFIVSFPVGVVTALAIALHEIPQEIGDFGVLIYSGFRKRKALLFNFISAVTAILGGLIGYALYTQIGSSIIFLLPFAAGSFVYIAAADLIPEIKHKTNLKKSLIHFFVFLSGIGVMLILKLL